MTSKYGLVQITTLVVFSLDQLSTYDIFPVFGLKALSHGTRQSRVSSSFSMGDMRKAANRERQAPPKIKIFYLFVSGSGSGSRVGFNQSVNRLLTTNHRTFNWTYNGQLKIEEKIVLSLMDFPELYDTSKISYRDINKKSRAWERGSLWVHELVCQVKIQICTKCPNSTLLRVVKCHDKLTFKSLDLVRFLNKSLLAHQGWIYRIKKQQISNIVKYLLIFTQTHTRTHSLICCLRNIYGYYYYYNVENSFAD